MAAPLTTAVDFLRRHGRAALGDAELLDRFRTHGDASAFAELVRRYGPLVRAVARRSLRDIHAADDAFQATFLLLIRKAASLREPGRLGPWLFGVARRTALKARAARVAEPLSADIPATDSSDDDLRAALDAAVDQLAEKYRTPVVLCYFQG
jgi:RNA polymerase sigma factor (sigma-70 family)